MKNTKIIPLHNHFRYNIFVNQKAIWDFLVKKGTQGIVTNITQVYVLSFLVAMMETRKSKAKYIIDDEGGKFIYATDKFILGNLIFLEMKSRQLKNILQQLERAYTIKRKTINRNQRYIQVNSVLMELWHTENWSITASSYMNTHMPRLWENLKSEWLPHIDELTFKEVIEWCNCEIDIQGIKYNNYDNILHLYRNTLKNWKGIQGRVKVQSKY